LSELNEVITILTESSINVYISKFLGNDVDVCSQVYQTGVAEY